MSRTLRDTFKARESIFNSGPEQYIGDIQARCPPDLEECVMAMEDCCEEAYEAQVLLRNGTRDLPRMTKVLQNERVFLLVNEDTIKHHKSALAEEIEPAISELIERAEQGLSGLEKREQILQTKVENAQNKPRMPLGTSAAQKLEARRLQTLVKQRERFESELATLEADLKKHDPKNRQ
ncbi:Spc19-domain-containing protein [Panaeolus papilionaceus]|nr:Spc19-domain-containing protein [Panaeolus papilionaceus]